VPRGSSTLPRACMTVIQKLDEYITGLSLMFEYAKDGETEGRAVEAFLEVSRLRGEVAGNREEVG
jgi:hypothetical protein